MEKQKAAQWRPVQFAQINTRRTICAADNRRCDVELRFPCPIGYGALPHRSSHFASYCGNAAMQTAKHPPGQSR